MGCLFVTQNRKSENYLRYNVHFNRKLHIQYVLWCFFLCINSLKKKYENQTTMLLFNHSAAVHLCPRLNSLILNYLFSHRAQKNIRFVYSYLKVIFAVFIYSCNLRHDVNLFPNEPTVQTNSISFVPKSIESHRS